MIALEKVLRITSIISDFISMSVYMEYIFRSTVRVVRKPIIAPPQKPPNSDLSREILWMIRYRLRANVSELMMIAHICIGILVTHSTGAKKSAKITAWSKKPSKKLVAAPTSVLNTSFVDILIQFYIKGLIKK